MAKRDIISAAKRKGVRITQAEYEWTPTPGESVPVWSIYIDPEDADRFGCEAFVQFPNTAETIDWIEGLCESEGESR